MYISYLEMKREREQVNRGGVHQLFENRNGTCISKEQGMCSSMRGVGEARRDKVHTQLERKVHESVLA